MEKVVANGAFKLVGTENQVSILAPVFTAGAPDFIAFPWERLNLNKPVPISWDDLNDGTLGIKAESVEDHRQAIFPRAHGDGEEGHAISRPGALLGEPTQRWMIAGVFWSDGRIKIDIRMENQPEAAREVMSAELAHAVDYGLPLSSAQKTKLVQMLHPGGADQHTWWEKVDYGSEYYTLVGEAFMAVFTHAYSNMTPYQDPFTHKSSKSMAPVVHQILGIIPTTGGSGSGTPVYSLKGYKTFHRETHYVSRWRSNPTTASRVIKWPSSTAARQAGLSPCQNCKPS